MFTHRPSSPARSLVRPAAVLAAALLFAGVALGQSSGNKKEEPLRPPTPPTSGSSWSPLLSTLVGIGAGALVLGAGLIPSKRGHQD